MSPSAIMVFQSTEKNAVISSNFLVGKSGGKTQLPHSRDFALPQNFHTRKLGEITVFYAVKAVHFFCLLSEFLIFFTIDNMQQGAPS